MNQLEINGFTYELEKKTPIVGHLSSSMMLNVETVFSDLTRKQLEALITAYKHGYFVFPRKMDLQSIALREKVVRTTLSEHLKKGQNKLFSNLVPYLYLYKEMNGFK
jgi:predicted DNA binding protein